MGATEREAGIRTEVGMEAEIAIDSATGTGRGTEARTQLEMETGTPIVTGTRIVVAGEAGIGPEVDMKGVVAGNTSLSAASPLFCMTQISSISIEMFVLSRNLTDSLTYFFISILSGRSVI